MTPPAAILDRELFGYLRSTGETVYRSVQVSDHLPRAQMRPDFAPHLAEYALRIRSCIDLILPDLLLGLTPRLTARERVLLANLGRWARTYSSPPVRRKLRRFVADVQRLPVHAEAS
jgi:hypothetical protein